MKSDDGQSNDTPRSSEPPPVLSPAPFAASTAALIAFDPKTRQVLVLDDPDFVDGVEKDSTIEHEGRALTILEKCSSREEATRISKLKAASMGAIGVDGCNYEESNDSSCMDRMDGLDEEEEEEEEEETDNTMVEISNRSSNMNAGGQLSDLFDSSGGNGNTAFRELLTMVLTDIDSDIRRLMQRQQSLREVLIKHIGTGSDGRILETFEPRSERLFVPTSKATARPSSLPSQQDVSYLQRLIEQRGQKRLYNEDEEEVTIRDHFKRPRVEGSQQTGSAQGAQIGRAGDVLRYPYISKEIEEEIYQQCRDSSSLYAQKLGRLLFADSLHLYFKDQDPKRRQWIHEAVDFRFPSEDKASQLLKWKNASFAINKNMRLSNQNNDPRNGREISYTYLSAAVEQEVFNRFPRDPIKYSEFMALRLFEKSLDRFFKDQDPKKKEWLRECLDKRFPLADKIKRDQRWKICAVACNRNRTKVLSEDGTEAEYPYFPQQKEEDCFKKAKGVPYVYAEEMAKLLFPTTSHLLFKDQDLGKRNWLHRILDKRFPTPDKFDQTAKWKSCTSAINKTAYRYADQKQNSSSPSVNSRQFAAPEKEKQKETKETNSEKENSTGTSGVAIAGSSTRTTSREKEREKEKEKEKEAHGKRESSRIQGKAKKEKVESYTSYPYITEAEELQIFEKTNGNLAKYAKELTRVIFKDTLHLYFKDQHAETRQWVKGIVDFRFPTKNALDYKQKWKNAGAAINSNMQLTGASAEQSQGKAAHSSTPSAAASSPSQPVTTRLTRSSRVSL